MRIAPNALAFSLLAFPLAGWCGPGTAQAQDLSAPRGVVSIPLADAPPGSPVLARQLPPETPAVIAQADAATPLTTFVDVLQRAYWTSPGVLAERARLRAADYRLPQARAAYGPRLDYQASYGWQRDAFQQPGGGFGSFPGWGPSATAILGLPVFTFGRNAAGENGSVAQIDYERATLRFTEAQTLLDAITAYSSVLRDRAGVDIAIDNLALLTRELSDNQTRFDAREVTLTDLQQVETRVELGRSQLLAAQRQAAASESAFLRVVGAPAGVLAPPNPLVIPVASLEDAYALAQAHNPVVSAAFARERISRAQRDGARSDLLPRVDLRGTASYQKTAPYEGNMWHSELRGEVVISGPIFQSGLLRARLDEASAANDADWRLIDGAERDSKAQTADAWNEWLTQRASIDRLRAAMLSAQAAYDGALQQERAGLRTTLDVLDLARDLLTARSSFNAASADAYIAQARILMATGTLELRYLLPDAAAYDADAHFQKVRRNGDIPLLTPLLREVDGIVGGHGKANRPLRDAAAVIGTQSIDVPQP